MNEENKELLYCKHCKDVIRKETSTEHSHYLKGCGDKIIEVICIKCWNKGIRWD